jgi:DNA-binding transcriptional LysR family regulator
VELHQIRYFLAAAETLNFTRAAERCAVTQPTLTKAIKKLEQDLGGPLFRRERNHTHLTELGLAMRDRLNVVHDGASAAKTAARKILNLEMATLHVGVMCTIGPAPMMNFFAGFQRDNPGVELILHETTPANLTGGLLDGGLDVCLLGLPTKLHERFDTRLLFRERMVVIFPPDHRFADLAAVPVAEFASERYLDRLNCEFRSTWFEMLEERGIDIMSPYQSEREDWIQNMVRAGLGVSLVPEYSIAIDGLACRPVTDPEIERRVELATVAGRRHSSALAAFLAAGRQHDWPVRA